MESFTRQFRAAARMLAVLTVLLGVAYPLVVWGVGRVAFPHSSQGSLIREGSVVIGSELIAQDFTGPLWFHPRPSAGGHDPLRTGGSNLGPGSAELRHRILQRRATVAAQDSVPGHPVDPAAVPTDAVTASGSGVDPYISPAYARQQIPRVARARDLAPQRVRDLVAASTAGPALGYLGRDRVNVVSLNAALTRVGA